MVIKMIQYTEVEFEEALQTVIATIANCEKMLPKFMEGTTNYKRLTKTIEAMKIAETLLNDQG